ncbi:MAG: VanZ family protein [Planctomycetaceae bacterium]|nr:VanZ family protein [Planctomycetaceae bacterium]
MKSRYSLDELHQASRRILIGYWTLLFISTHIPLWFVHMEVPKDSDKVAHFLGYGGLMFCLRGWQWLSARVDGEDSRNRKRYRFWFAALVLVLYSVLDELLQIPVYRSADVRDAIADWIGLTIGAICFEVLRPVVLSLFLETAPRTESPIGD